MSRFSHYLSIGATIVIGVITVVLANEFVMLPQASRSVLIPTSASVVEAPRVANATTSAPARNARVQEAIAPKTITSTTRPVKITEMKVVAPVTQAAVQVVPTVLANSSLDTVSAALRSALVNIICYAPTGSGLHSISGSGIFIDTKGIILTNAHVAQYFLLADRGVSCTIRRGSPASDAYKAALIYISPSWIHTNATVITQTLPSGTGEFDFALLAVTRSDTSEPLPALFPSLPLSYQAPATNTPVVIASFGAQFLDPSQIRSSLYPTIVFGSIKNVFTFATTSIDVLSLGGSAAAQEGSSGGGVADASGALVGTITTSTVEGATDTRTLSAITASYIRSAYTREMGSSLDLLLNEPIATALTEFPTNIPVLESILTAHL